MQSRPGRFARGNRGRPASIGALGLVLILAGGSLAGGLLPVREASTEGPPRVGENVPVTPTDLIRKPANNSPAVAADPTDSRFVALANRLDGPDFGCALQVSGDGGQSWVSADPVPDLPAGADKCYAPEIAFDGDGTLHYLFVGLHGAGNEPMGAFLTTSSDAGRSFSQPRRVLGPQNYQVRMAIDPDVGDGGRMHLVWLHATSDPPTGGMPPPPNPIMAAYSDDGGKSFSTRQISDPERNLVHAPALALGPDQSVHVVYYDLEEDTRDYFGLKGPTWEGQWSLVATRSTDGGATFGPGVVVDSDVSPPERVMLIYTMPPPSVAASASGSLYAAWYDGRNGDWDVFLRRSLDGGGAWGPAQRLNDDAMRNGRHQYLPRLSVAPTGRLDAVFYDRRGNVENRGNDVYYTYSNDEGRTFAKNIRLTSLDSDSMIGPSYDIPSALGMHEFGSRLGLWSEPLRAVAAWTDTRNTGGGPPAQDIFSAFVFFSQSDEPQAWARPAGAALVVVGLGVMGAWLRGGRRRRPRTRAADA